MTDSLPRRVRIGLLTGACLYALGGMALAQAETLDFRQAVDVALRQNPDLMAVQAQMAQARAGINQAEGAKMPKITVSAGVTRTNDALNAFGIKLSQRQATFNDFGANQFLGPQSLGVAGKALEAAQSQVKTVDSLFKQGVVIKSDLLSAQVRQEDVKLQQDQAANMEAQAMDALHVVLGVPLNQPITLGPEVMVTLPEGDPNAWVGLAMERNPQIQALQHQIAAANGKIEVARSDRYPQVGAMARFDTNDPNVGFESRSYTVGAQLNWTIFDGGVTRSAVDQAVAKRMELQAKLQSEQNQLGMQVQDTYRKAVDAANQVKTRELAVTQAEEAARIVS
ncbi:MAG: transporter, partial [Thiomonas sp. 20-64-5]